MILFLYMLLRETPTETSDPYTKEQYGLPLILHHSFGEVVTAVLQLLMAIIAIDIVADGIFPMDVKECLAEYLAHFLMVVIPGISCLITALLYSGLLVER